jgi:hypothetical protein
VVGFYSVSTGQSWFRSDRDSSYLRRKLFLKESDSFRSNLKSTQFEDQNLPTPGIPSCRGPGLVLLRVGTPQQIGQRWGLGRIMMGVGAVWSGDYFADAAERIIRVAVWGEILPYFSLL